MTIKSNIITEYTSDTGVTIDSVRIQTYAHGTADGHNMFIGPSAGNFTLSPAGGAATLASDNTGVGEGALAGLTTGYANTTLGHYAGNGLTTSYKNIAIGENAQRFATLGHDNVTIGNSTLQVNTTGYQNVAVGTEALNANTEGEGNSAIGLQALLSNTTGIGNIAMGVGALRSNLVGTGNTSLGTHSGDASTGEGNTFLGWQSGYTVATGSYNVFLGLYSGYYETGSNKLFIDNAKRASEADARAKALIYGVFDAAVANQYVVVNGGLRVSGGPLWFTTDQALQWGAAGYDGITANGTFHFINLYINTATKLHLDATGIGINDESPAEALDVTGNINATGVIKIDDVQVVSNRVVDARCADVANSGDATTDGLIDALRDAMIAHGLLAAA